jgi:hypothetical protein
MGEDRSSCCGLRLTSIVESGDRPEVPMSTRTVYQIEVRGEISKRYATAFEGMEMETKSGRTILTGEIVDDSHLHGILARIIAMGLRLVSVESVSGER